MKRLIFILSASHVGSTLLDLMLGSHPECSSLGEAWRKDGDGCDLCGGVCEKWAGFDYKKDGRFYKKLFERFDTPILVDSSKKEDWVREIYFKMADVKVIRLRRDGRRRLLAYKEEFGEVSAKQVKRWIRKEKKIRWATRGIPCLNVRYEDICDGDALQKCCDYIGIDYKPEMREYWTAAHHGYYGSCRAFSLVKAHHGKALTEKESSFVEKQGFVVKSNNDFSFLNAEELKVFEKRAGDLNRKFGYGN